MMGASVNKLGAMSRVQDRCDGASVDKACRRRVRCIGQQFVPSMMVRRVRAVIKSGARRVQRIG
jgi:hypothetical protein